MDVIIGIVMLFALSIIISFVSSIVKAGARAAYDKATEPADALKKAERDADCVAGYFGMSDEDALLAKIGQEAIDYVEKNFDDVGCDFAKEALKIHYGAVEPRNIRGISTKEEEKTLKDEGIQFFKIPIPVVPETDS